MRYLILFQTYIEIFNKIEDVNLAALVVSSITIVTLVVNNEILKVSTGQLSLFLCVMCMYVCVFIGSNAYLIQKNICVYTHVCACVCVLCVH
jgi:hypothetical protein